MPNYKIYAILGVIAFVIWAFLFKKFLAYQKAKNEYLSLKFRLDILKTRLMVLLKIYNKNPIYKDDILNLEIINEHKKSEK